MFFRLPIITGKGSGGSTGSAFKSSYDQKREELEKYKEYRAFVDRVNEEKGPCEFALKEKDKKGRITTELYHSSRYNELYGTAQDSIMDMDEKYISHHYADKEKTEAYIASRDLIIEVAMLTKKPEGPRHYHRRRDIVIDKVIALRNPIRKITLDELIASKAFLSAITRTKE